LTFVFFLAGFSQAFAPMGGVHFIKPVETDASEYYVSGAVSKSLSSGLDGLAASTRASRLLRWGE
jgi:hypothetical protein